VRRLIALATVAGMTSLGLVSVTGPAQAVVPGTNGQIVFETLIPNQPDDMTLANVFTANPDGSHALQVPLPYQPEVFSFPVWSPNGTRLLLSHVFRLDSSGNCCLPFRPAIVTPDGSGFTLLEMPYAPFDMDCPVWSLDQTRILCGFGGDHPGVFSVRASDGGDPIRLTTNPYGTSDQEAQDLPTDVSPDGTRFVFIRFKPGPQQGQRPFAAKQAALFVENIDGTGLRQITPFGVTHPHDFPWADWSPDGKKIIAATTEGGLFTVQPDGAGLTMIHLQVGTGTYTALEPHWSPNGKRIIFLMFPFPTTMQEGIFTAKPDGSDVVRVTTTPTLDSSPDWGPHPLAT
jgi:Tol biopolymer transport system component